jgi:hypothetical protein
VSIIITGDEVADAGLFASDHLRAELDVREQNGASVTLFWIRGTDLLVVSVVDRGSGPSFELVLEPAERALDVFHHPYAYAAARGLDTLDTLDTLSEEEEVVDV